MITNVKPSQPAAQDVCVVYCRVSSTEQAAVDRASLDAQERRLLPLAKELGLPILYVKKHAESASILDKRSEFQQVLADAKAQKFQVLLVDRMNRFSRSEDLSEYMQVMTRLKEAGVRVVFAEKQYDNTPTGQLQAFVDAYASAVEQANRRKQSRDGKHGRVHTHKHPLPGHKPPYGYRWVQTPDGQVKKTNLEKTADQTQETVERIWRYFLQDEEPTMRGMAMRLNRAHVPPPRRAHGVAGAGDRWYASSIQAILHNGVYWGEPTTFAKSKYDEPTAIPAYAPTYVTPEEARRVHLRLETNQKYAPRNRQREWGTLLHGGIARCAACGSTLLIHEVKQRNQDGTESSWRYYQCGRQAREGKERCRGTSITADVLDFAVILTLDARVRQEGFLQKIFEAWDQDQEAAMGEVRRAEHLYKETQEKVNNLTGRLASYAPDDPAAAPVEATMRMLAAQLPGLAQQRDRAAQAVTKARNNTALRDELYEWFGAWLHGWQYLSRERQRQFLLALNATVRVWRAGDRDPQAQLVIGLPTNALDLPPAPPEAISAVSDGDEPWRADVDTAYAAWLAAYIKQTNEAVAYTLETLGVELEPLEPPPATAEAVMAAVEEQLRLTRQGGACAIVNDTSRCGGT